MGSYKYRDTGRITILITHIRALRARLTTTHEPPSRYHKALGNNSRSKHEMPLGCLTDLSWTPPKNLLQGAWVPGFAA